MSHHRHSGQGRGRCASRREHPGHGDEHGHHHRGEARERGGRGERRRLFAHGDLRLLVLHLIGEKPRHGYELIKAIEESTGGAYSPSPGVIYPTLTLLEELGHVSIGPSDGPKKLHAITPDGRAHLEAYRPTVDALLARMRQSHGERAGGPPPRVTQALENLALALRTRLARGPLSDGQVEAVGAAIDAAAMAVDRS